MIEVNRVEELIQFHKQNLKQTDMAAEMFGAKGNPIVEMTKKLTNELLADTIKVLEDYRNLLITKKLLDK